MIIRLREAGLAPSIGANLACQDFWVLLGMLLMWTLSAISSVTVLTMAFAGYHSPASSRPELANIGQLFSTEDYPADALREAKQGMVAVQIDVDDTGAPLNCGVSKSSHVPSLDEATCRVIMARARFSVGHDQSGHAVGGRTNVRIRWALPSGKGEPFTDAVLVASYSVAADNRFTDCHLQINRKDLKDMGQCAAIKSTFEKMALGERLDRPIANHRISVINGVVIGMDETGSLFQTLGGPGYPVGMIVSLAVDSSGKPGECEVRQVNWEAGDEALNAICALALKRRFEQIPKVGKYSAPRHLLILQGILIHD